VAERVVVDEEQDFPGFIGGQVERGDRREQLLGVVKSVGAEVRALVGYRGQPRVGDEHTVGPDGDRLQGRTPVAGKGLRDENLGDDVLGHQIEQLIFAGDVGVDAHRPDGELRCDTPDGDGRKSVAIGERDGCCDDLVALARSRPPRVARGKGGPVRHRQRVPAAVQRAAKRDTVYGMPSPSDVFSGPAVTALGLAASRTVESNRPDRLINDPLARTFFEAAGLNLPMRLSWPEPGENVSDTERLHLHGSRYIGLRTRFYDDFLLGAAASRGLRQGVLIGAGLDTRAFRLQLPPDFHLIEIDQTTLLEWKQNVIEAEGLTPTCGRSWIGADLREGWTENLTRRGFDAARGAAFVAEGLLPYLDPEQQRRLLDQIDALATTGSALAADRIVGDPHATNRAATLTRRSGLDMAQLLASGENNDIERMLRARGWNVRETAVADLAVSYGRDLTDPLGEPEAEGPAEPPWLETRFLQASR
jgi:methyltransferase (TIGR00027 family)